MALKPHNFNLPFNIQRCSHVHCTVKDLDASRRFYVDIMGFIETERTKDTIYLRGLEEKNHHCYVLEQGEKAEVLALGFKVGFDKDLDALASVAESGAAGQPGGLGKPAGRSATDRHGGGAGSQGRP